MWCIEKVGKKHDVWYQYLPSCKRINVCRQVEYDVAVKLGTNFVPPQENEAQKPTANS